MTRALTRLLLALGAVMASGCGGCGARTPSEPERPSPQPVLETPVPESSPAPEFLRTDRRLLELAGEPDFSNRYLAAVKVTAMEGEEERMHCGGVVISPRVVLTAGHCVCGPRRSEHPNGEGGPVITASDCYDRAQIETLTYGPETMAGATLRPSRGTMHEGQVHPHPALKVVLDPKGRVLSSHADLAVIFLSMPVEFAGLPLADEEVRQGETITIVGQGYDEVAGVFGWERRSCLNQVTRLQTVEDERVLIQQPGGHRYRQDSGGPCLRQGTKGPELVGISSRWLGEGAAFSSTHAYRNWLREAIQRAQPTPRPGGDHSP